LNDLTSRAWPRSGTCRRESVRIRPHIVLIMSVDAFGRALLTSNVRIGSTMRVRYASGMSARGQGLGAAFLVGAIYTALGVAASTIGGTAASAGVGRAARWATFLLSGIAFVLHVVRERAGGSAVWSAARRSALAAAIGGLGLALAANVHELVAGEGYRPRLLVALVVWPVLTGVPAFLGASVLSAMVAPRSSSRPG
jgi:hypothetical protein